MAIAFVTAASASTADAGVGNQLAVTAPTGLVSGNVLVAVVYVRNSSSTPTSVTASGWTEHSASDTTSGAPGFSAILWKVVGGSEPGSYTFTINDGAADDSVSIAILQYSGVDTTTPIETASISRKATASTTSTAPTLTLSGTADMLISAFGANTNTAPSAPTSATREAFTNSGVTVSMVAFDRLLSASGSSPTQSTVFSNNQSTSNISVALQPPSGTAASGSGSLSLSGSAISGQTATASLTLTGSGTAHSTAAATASAALTLSGSGVPRLAGTATASLSLSGAGYVGASTVRSFAVQLDTTGSAFGTAFVGTDVTASAVAGFDFSPITIVWGRQDQYGQVQPTNVTGTFINKTGDLTPGRAASIYYPHIRRGLHRRIAMSVNYTTIPLSDDFANSITVDAGSPTLWTTEIDGTDLLQRYSATPSSDNPTKRVPGTTLRSFIVEEMMLDNPIALYLFQESEGATSFSDATGNNTAGTIHNSTFGPGYVDAGQEPLTPANGVPTTWYGGTFTQITNAAYLTWTSGDAAGSWIGLPLHTPSSGGFATACTFELWVSTFVKKPKNYAVIVNGHQSFSIWIDKAGKVNFGDTTTNPPVAWGTGPFIADGAVHQLAISWDGSAQMAAYVDGVMVATASFASAPDSTPMNMGFGPGFTAPFIGGVAYWAMYSHVVSNLRINAHYHAGADAFVGERSDLRIARLLSYRPNYGMVLDTGTVTMGIQEIQGRSLTDCLLEVGQAEAGAVFVDGLGRVNFRARSRLTSPTTTVTLNCLAGDVMVGGTFRDDTQNVLNDVTVSTPLGSDQRYYDASSINLDGEFSTSVSVPLQTDAQALALATWMVQNGVQENLTFDSLTVNLLTCSAATAAAVLALKPLDIVQVTNIDVNATRAPSTTMSFVVQGGTLTLGMDAMTATLNVTPMPV